VVQEGNLYRLSLKENPKEDIRMDTQLAYQNLLEKADYSNLSNKSLYLNYEDYQARIINPLRMSFNSLAIALLNEGDKATAEKVMDFALQKLYLRHLEPSYTSLQAADILVALGKEDLARSLCITLFDFHYDQVQSNLKEGKDTDKLDRYLAEQSAQMLDQLGEKKYSVMLNDLGLGFGFR